MIGDGGRVATDEEASSPWEAPKLLRLAEMSTFEVRNLADGDQPVVACVPVGSVEPHGPHLPLETDTIISRAAIERAGSRLADSRTTLVVTPAVEYGVTQCAGGFTGALSIEPETLVGYLRDIVRGLLDDGVDHVCLVNNHLEPAHDSAVRRSIEPLDSEGASVATPLKKKWARKLSDEFKRGACHAGKYETSIVMAAAPERVQIAELDGLDEVPISLSDQIRDGVEDFREMGLEQAYAGAPGEATAEHGDEMLDCLAEMIVGEIGTSLGVDLLDDD